jgi:transposase
VRLDLAHLPDDPSLLHQLIRDLAADNERRAGEIEKLRLLIQQLRRGQFGRRSERLEPNQFRLSLEDLDADVARAEVSQPPAATEAIVLQKPRLSFPSHLPSEDVTIEPDHAACPSCGGVLHPIGVTTSEMLDWIPATVRVVRVHRPKHGCRACGTIHQAAAPERLLERGLATPALIAHVLVSKYCDHTPLYRQSQILKRLGVEIDRSTLANWVGGACWWLEPLHERLAKQIFASTKLFADDTPMPVLDPGRGRTKTGRLWVYARDDRPWKGADPPAAIYSTAPTAERNGQSRISRGSGASCRSMDTRDSSA